MKIYNQITNNSCEVFSDFIEENIIPSCDDSEMKKELVEGFKEKLYMKMKEDIKNHIAEWLKHKLGVDDHDINNLPLSGYMDSLDIFDLVVEIEDHYKIAVSEKELLKWYDGTVDDISEYVNSTLGK